MNECNSAEVLLFISTGNVNQPAEDDPHRDGGGQKQRNRGQLARCTKKLALRTGVPLAPSRRGGERAESSSAPCAPPPRRQRARLRPSSAPPSPPAPPIRRRRHWKPCSSCVPKTSTSRPAGCAAAITQRLHRRHRVCKGSSAVHEDHHVAKGAERRKALLLLLGRAAKAADDSTPPVGVLLQQLEM